MTSESSLPSVMPENLFQAELILDTKCILGEGPFWDGDKAVLWWIDVKGHLVQRYDPSNGTNTTYNVGQSVGTVVCRQSGGLVLATENGFVAFDPQTGQLEMLTDPEADRPDNRFNDGKCDPAGRFWAGTMQDAEVDFTAGSLYCLDLKGRVRKWLDGVGISNGIAWTSNQLTMYYIDSPTRRVDAFDFEVDSGSLSNRRTAFEIPEGMGFPDGMAIDADDKLWVALWNGSCVGRFDPLTGRLLARVDVPAPFTSACAFGGPNRDRLYITSARKGMSDDALQQYPLSGGLFYADVNVPGAPLNKYLG